MAVKRKISVHKVLQVLLTIVATTGCIMAMVSAATIEDAKMVKNVSVHIKNDKKYHFIQEKEILELAVYRRNVDLAKTPMSRLDIKSMERVILADPWVANAQVYVDKDNVLQIYITQRIPVARCFQQNGVSYYLDTTLSIMPLSSSNIYYTTVVTNVPELRNDSISWALRKDIISLVRTIQADSFWNAQVSQIIVDSADMYELVPMLGDQRILFGDASEMKEKFGNLFAFYKNVLNRIGWDKYELLDLRFNGQVVASPSLPYKGPVDKAVNGMNWINSIIISESINDSLHNTEPREKPVVDVKPAGSAKQDGKAALAASPKKDAKKPDAKKDAKKPDAKKDAGKPDAKRDAKGPGAKKDGKKADPKKDAKKPDPKKDIKKKADDKKKDDNKKKTDTKSKPDPKKKPQAKPPDKNKDKNKQNNKQKPNAKENQQVKKVH